jgi:hypothetical protein
MCLRHGQDKAVERRAEYLQAEDTPCRRLEGTRWEAERTEGSMWITTKSYPSMIQAAPGLELQHVLGVLAGVHCNISWE